MEHVMLMCGKLVKCSTCGEKGVENEKENNSNMRK